MGPRCSARRYPLIGVTLVVGAVACSSGRGQADVARWASPRTPGVRGHPHVAHGAGAAGGPVRRRHPRRHRDRGDGRRRRVLGRAGRRADARDGRGPGRHRRRPRRTGALPPCSSVRPRTAHLLVLRHGHRRKLRRAHRLRPARRHNCSSSRARSCPSTGCSCSSAQAPSTSPRSPVSRCRSSAAAGTPLLSGSVNGSRPSASAPRPRPPTPSTSGSSTSSESAQASRAPFVRLADRVAVPFTLLAFVVAGGRVVAQRRRRRASPRCSSSRPPARCSSPRRSPSWPACPGPRGTGSSSRAEARSRSSPGCGPRPSTRRAP